VQSVASKRSDKVFNKKLLLMADPTYKDGKIKLMPEDNQEFILGWLILNRCVSIAYRNLDLSTLHRDIRKALKVLADADKKRSEIFKHELQLIVEKLKGVDFDYAFLKGTWLSLELYSDCERTSKDFDILINSKDISKLQGILLSCGYIQGWASSDYCSIVPATRRQIIESRLNYGETVPFVKLVGGISVSVDINFSVDFKPDEGNGLVQKLLSRVEEYKNADFSFMTLSSVDFFIHLCCHLFKEATTYDWVVDRRDLELYKFNDISMFLQKKGDEKFFKELMIKVKEYGVENECYFSLKNTLYIFPKLETIKGVKEFLNEIEPNNLKFMKEIIYPRSQKVYFYSEEFLDWFMSNNRISLLQER